MLLSSSSDASARVSCSITSDGIAEVALNRPEKLNALDMDMFRSLKRTILEIQDNKKVRVVLLRGHGRAFCTGLDVPSIVKHAPIASSKELLEKHPRPTDDLSLSDSIATIAETTNLAQEVGYLWRQLTMPVLCSIHGLCYGGGLQIALGADLRYCSPDAKLSILESKWGLIPDMSASVTLRELLSIDVAKELTFTGRQVSGQEAQALGLVTRVVDDPWQHAQKFAKDIVNQSPDALKFAKQLYQQTWRCQSEQECLELETAYQKQLLLSWNQVAKSARNFNVQVPYKKVS